MSEFSLWFTTGLQHILDLHGYDHILYIMGLCALYSTREWKNLLLLVTAFTVGHSVTLACSVLRIISVKQAYVEVLIPITIMLTCVFNIVNRNKPVSRFSLNYFLALFFGCIHGLGFSYLLRSMLGAEEQIAWPLLAFNTGLEVGQLVIVTSMLLISVFLYRFTPLKKPGFVLGVSLPVFMVAVWLLYNRLNEI